MNTHTPLRFGVLLEGVRLSRWQAECVSRLVSSGAARLELIIKAVPPKDKERPLRRALSLLRHGLWRAYLFSLKRQISTRPSDPKLFHDVQVFACDACSGGGVLNLEDAETEKIRSRRLDFILYFSENTPADGLATIAAHGIWCFRYGEALEPSGELAAFGAALRRDNVVRVGLVRFIGGRAAERRLLRDGYFAVPGYSFKRTLVGILRGSVDFPVLACRDLLTGRELGRSLGDA